MKIIVQHLSTMETIEIPDVSKTMLVNKLKEKVKEMTGIDINVQILIFGGKILNDNFDLCDYKIENGHKILLQDKQQASNTNNATFDFSKLTKGLGNHEFKDNPSTSPEKKGSDFPEMEDYSILEPEIFLDENTEPKIIYKQESMEMEDSKKKKLKQPSLLDFFTRK